MVDVTVIIPIGPDHIQAAEAAIESVKAQTIGVGLIAVTDNERKGPGYARNVGLSRASTPYVVFLDADDTLDPAFCETTLQAAEPNTYVYADWWEGDRVVNAPGYPWCAGTWHVITALLPTDAVRAVGGFDEFLPGAEDTDLYLKLTTSGYCGKRIPMPLMHYTNNGQRSKQFRFGPKFNQVMQEFTRRYGGKMGCCGKSGPAIVTTNNEKQPGDVLALAAWDGNVKTVGAATGRVYPRTGNGRQCWVDPADVAQSKPPYRWQRVAQAAVPKAETPFGVAPVRETVTTAQVQPGAPIVLNGLQEIAAAMDGLMPGSPAPITPAPSANGTPKPNLNRVIRLGRKAITGTAQPIFAMPRHNYPSYADFRRLVHLSGFDACYIDELNPDDTSAVYIVVSPEAPFGIHGKDGERTAWKLNGKAPKARVIWWDLEWEYASKLRPSVPGIAEVWASDRWYASVSGARFVALGSHPGLNLEPDAPKPEPRYDVTMLAYMTPRRNTIKQRLNNLQWTPDYPGHGNQDRHEALRQTRLMVHVHQTDGVPTIAPQRFAVAAAYKLPLISEMVNDPVDLAGGSKAAVRFATYDHLPLTVKDILGKPDELRAQGEALYERLCVENTFEKCVRAALA